MAPVRRGIFGTLALAAALGLAGCVGTSALSRLDRSRPLGGPFSQALFKNYAYLAHSFGDVGAPTSGTPFDADNSISIGSMSSNIADIANLYAEKALAVSEGGELLPEDPRADLPGSDTLHQRLLRDLYKGRDDAPVSAARAQAEYDCWVVNARADSLKRASERCHRALPIALAQLEADLVAARPPPASAVSPVMGRAAPGAAVTPPTPPAAVPPASTPPASAPPASAPPGAAPPPPKP